jgi:hypothetical protein
MWRAFERAGYAATNKIRPAKIKRRKNQLRGAKPARRKSRKRKPQPTSG